MKELKRRVLDWRSRRSWAASIRYYASEVLTSAVRSEVSEVRPNCWSDDMRWLPDHEWRVEAFRERMVGYYSHFRAFHGCRITDMSSYQRDGLLGQDPSRIQKTFRELFSDWPEEELARSIAEFAPSRASEVGRIWLLGCDKELVQRCGHYLIQGSEYLMALAGALGGVLAQRRLREKGVPTVIEVDLPVELVPEEQQMELARSILSTWGQHVARRQLGVGDGPPCFTVRHSVPPEHIRAHWHPARIVDPHRRHLPYLNRVRVCPSCASQMVEGGIE